MTQAGNYSAVPVATGKTLGFDVTHTAGGSDYAISGLDSSGAKVYYVNHTLYVPTKSTPGHFTIAKGTDTGTQFIVSFVELFGALADPVILLRTAADVPVTHTTTTSADVYTVTETTGKFEITLHEGLPQTMAFTISGDSGQVAYANWGTNPRITAPDPALVSTS